MRVVVLAAACVSLTIAIAPGSCPAGINTACASDGSQTCCPIFMSLSGWGCCNMPGASCCPASSTTQGCCPAGTTCVLTGEYSATCVPSSSGPNISALQVCTPGAEFPPSSTLPSMIIIGDSVSEGYEPVVAANLSKAVYVQHSPWSQGGGADDVFNGLNCGCRVNGLISALSAPSRFQTFPTFPPSLPSSLPSSLPFHSPLRAIETGWQARRPSCAHRCTCQRSGI
jgi:hypothetical protein